MSLPQPFLYPALPHSRKHAPAGYRNYQDYKPWLRDEFEFRCVYCLQREMWSRERYAIFSVDHILPQSTVEGMNLICDYLNLTYSCMRCNSFKQNIQVLDPTKSGMADHLRVEPDGTVTGLTETGQFLIELLHLNSNSAQRQRRRISTILVLRERYPEDKDVLAMFSEDFGYPEDLPDLTSLRPPAGNPAAAIVHDCFHARRQRGELPVTY